MKVSIDSTHAHPTQMTFATQPTILLRSSAARLLDTFATKP